jgi:hypothetical protein
VLLATGLALSTLNTRSIWVRDSWMSMPTTQAEGDFYLCWGRAGAHQGMDSTKVEYEQPSMMSSVHAPGLHVYSMTPGPITHRVRSMRMVPAWVITAQSWAVSLC